MFKEALQSIVEKTDGSLGALIMGADGLSVEKFFTEEGDDANLDELVVSLGKVTFVVRLFNKDYFAVLALKPDGNLGRGRYELRKAELVLAKEFAV